MASLPLILFGAGGHGKVVADAAAGNWRVFGFIDDARTGEHGGYPILGNQKALEKLKEEGVHCIVSIGGCAARAKVQQMLEDMGFPMAIVIHPSAAISQSARIGAGSAILAQTVVGPDAVLGKGCIVNTSASVDHDCSVGDYTHIAPGAHIAGGVKIGTQTFIGIGSSVRELSSIGNHVVIGAGAAVVTDFGDGITALGVPAVARKAS
ncbi:hypothetical protein AUJ46_03105 [Candidatus Peregrinibacteria bacterium CG1_02_54_53]|nr:MAG: hypothetical protein AUJ46_03105 [Candidatus Peregrinibacteria bacterium CG1_02_54_53]